MLPPEFRNTSGLPVSHHRLHRDGFGQGDSDGYRDKESFAAAGRPVARLEHVVRDDGALAGLVGALADRDGPACARLDEAAPAGRPLREHVVGEVSGARARGRATAPQRRHAAQNTSYNTASTWRAGPGASE